jgi:hypothetical protein
LCGRPNKKKNWETNVNDKETAACILLAYEAGRPTQGHGSQERCHSHGVLPQEQHA